MDQAKATTMNLSRRGIVLIGLGAVASFHLAYWQGGIAWLMIAYLGCLTALTRVGSNRGAFYTGLAVGLGVFVPQMDFLWKIFGVAAIPLWFILASWHGLFLVLGRQGRLRFGPIKSLLLLPFLWLGLEYFRSEIYFLRFSWFNAGYAFWESPGVVTCLGGVYGVGFFLMTLSIIPELLCALSPARRWLCGVGIALVASLLVIQFSVLTRRDEPILSLPVAGIQLEFPNQSQVSEALDQLVAKHPEARLLVLSEYTFDGPIPDSVRAWCKKHDRWLIAGGKDELGGGNYYNTAFVVSTNGEVVFKQAKCMPIQFFKDGLPAPGQRVWESPWGTIGICICYDQNYRRVTDELVRLGAELIIVPTMDVAEWGLHQHQLHARVAPVRAAEYGVPIFRLCSSGISQIVSGSGKVLSSGSFPGEGEMVSGTIFYRSSGARLPVDSVLAPLAMVLTASLAFWFSTRPLFHRLRRAAVPAGSQSNKELPSSIS